MENYLIHTCAERKWYVEEFLIPSMIEQGIKNISVYIDYDGDGNLTSLMKSYKCARNRDTWHLQDDIIISSRFKELTEENNKGIVCGFCNGFSGGQPGVTNVRYNMWYSMPCIRIPGDIFTHFISWLNDKGTQERYKFYFDENKHDDVLFQCFLMDNYPQLPVLNLAPNIVNHIDHLMGGSLINKARDKKLSFVMAKYWYEPELIIDIEEKLRERRQ